MEEWKNACFEGGGVKGIGLTGSACYMAEVGVWDKLENFCGTSAGAIFALLACLGYTPQQIKAIMFSADFNLFKDQESYWRKLRNLTGKYGIHSGKYFEDWIKGHIKEVLKKEDATFADLRAFTKKNLYVITGNISTGFSENLCFETTPTLPLWKAVRMSMAIPFYFTSVTHPFKVSVIGKKGEEKQEVKDCIFSDGGIFQNYPIQFFDDPRFCEADANGEYHNSQTIGFKLDSKDKIDILINNQYPFYQKVRNIVQYIEKLINSLMNCQDNYYRTSDDWKRTIFIDTLGVSTTDFNLTLDQKNELFKSGYLGAKKFFFEKGISR